MRVFGPTHSCGTHVTRPNSKRSNYNCVSESSIDETWNGRRRHTLEDQSREKLCKGIQIRCDLICFSVNNRANASSDWWKRTRGGKHCRQNIIAISLQTVATIVQLILSFRWNGVRHFGSTGNLHWMEYIMIAFHEELISSNYSCSWKGSPVDSLEIGISHR